jgi:hypothetical protein
VQLDGRGQRRIAAREQRRPHVQQPQHPVVFHAGLDHALADPEQAGIRGPAGPGRSLHGRQVIAEEREQAGQGLGRAHHEVAQIELQRQAARRRDLQEHVASHALGAQHAERARMFHVGPAHAVPHIGTAIEVAVVLPGDLSIGTLHGGLRLVAERLDRHGPSHARQLPELQREAAIAAGELVAGLAIQGEGGRIQRRDGDALLARGAQRLQHHAQR